MTGRRRADLLLVARGLVSSRARAQAEIAAGHVRADGVAIAKPGALLTEDTVLTIENPMPYVSRGALKLAHALVAFGIDPAGGVALDIGASTGGFTEILLERGATRVFAVDVGRGQLHPKLAADPRVMSLEGRDVRSLSAADIPEPVDLLTIDVSFIGLAKALTPALAFVKPGGSVVALVKPQFEVGPGGVGKGGVVRDAGLRQAAVDGVAAWIAEHAPLTVLGVIDSPVLGGDGNAEAFLAARRR